MADKPQFIPLYQEDLKTIENEGQHAMMLARAVIYADGIIADVLLSIFVGMLLNSSDEDNPHYLLDRLADIIAQAKAA